MFLISPLKFFFNWCTFIHFALIFDILRVMKLCREYSLPHGVSVLRFMGVNNNQAGKSNLLLAGTSNGRAYLLDEQQSVGSLPVDKSTIWNLGQVPHSRDYVSCLGSGAVDVLRVRPVGAQPELVKLCSSQLSEAPITGSLKINIHVQIAGLGFKFLFQTL
jgi:hypothetical protein